MTKSGVTRYSWRTSSHQWHHCREGYITLCFFTKARTIRNTVQNATEEPFACLADEFEVLKFYIFSATRFNLMIRDCECIIALGITKRDMDMAELCK